MSCSQITDHAKEVGAINGCIPAPRSQQHVWEMTLSEFLESGKSVYSERDLKNFGELDYLGMLWDAIRAEEDVPEHIVVQAGNYLGNNLHTTWKDFKTPETVVRKYGLKPKNMSIKKYAELLKQELLNLSNMDDGILVGMRFEEEAYREFLSQFTEQEFVNLVMNTRTQAYTPGNYSIDAYPGLTFSGNHNKNSGVYVCTGYDKPFVENAKLIEDEGEDEGINFLFFEDYDKGVAYYYQLRKNG